MVSLIGMHAGRVPPAAVLAIKQTIDQEAVLQGQHSTFGLTNGAACSTPGWKPSHVVSALNAGLLKLPTVVRFSHPNLNALCCY